MQHAHKISHSSGIYSILVSGDEVFLDTTQLGPHRPPSRRRISELAAEFLSAKYQPKKFD